MAHHVTHEPGGSDALVNAAWTHQINQFTLPQRISNTGGNIPRVTLTNVNQPVETRVWEINTGNTLNFWALNDAENTIITAIAFDRGGNLKANGYFFEAQRTTAMGFPIQVAWSGGYTYPAGTWTNSTVFLFQYTMVGKTIVLSMMSNASTTTGGVTHLGFTNPTPAGLNSYAAGYARITIAGVPEVGHVYCNLNDPSVYIMRANGQVWPATIDGIWLTITIIAA